MRIVLGSVVLAMALSSASLGKVPLREEAYINGALLSAAVGDEIRKNCPTISARYFTFFSERNKLKRYALDRGYSEAEIEAFIDSKVERERMERLRDAYLQANGVVKGDADSYCRLGRQEIAKGSLTGRLLRSR